MAWQIYSSASYTHTLQTLIGIGCSKSLLAVVLLAKVLRKVSWLADVPFRQGKCQKGISLRSNQAGRKETKAKLGKVCLPGSGERCKVLYFL